MSAAGGERNWARNLAYGTSDIRFPTSIAEVQAIVAATSRLRVLGTRHCFSAIADSSDLLLSLRDLPSVLRIDRECRQVSVAGGVPYGRLCEALDGAGLALHNLASLPHISVAGAVVTATHGSGLGNRNLAAPVAAMTLVDAGGALVSLRRGDALFDAAVVGLGCFGPVVALTLDLEPAFAIAQEVHLDLPFASVVDQFDAIMGAAYSVSLFTTWTGEKIDQIWIKRRPDREPPLPSGFFGASPAARAMHPVADIAPDACTAQLGAPGPWWDRLPHFQFKATPSAGDELQAEYFVARADAVAALRAIDAMREAIAPHLLVSEIRTVASDDFWMSPHYRRESVAIHFTLKPDWPAVRTLLPRIEAALAPFDARPHWGKLFTMAPARVRALYPRLPDFVDRLRQVDPRGKFRNAFIHRILFED
ncbi:MAG: D-arabinono-1,4-lactone oxidase [Alphaproteobacteria bacterium]